MHMYGIDPIFHHLLICTNNDGSDEMANGRNKNCQTKEKKGQTIHVSQVLVFVMCHIARTVHRTSDKKTF
jgi:hypothetical protein